jgi:hypothetical protein
MYSNGIILFYPKILFFSPQQKHSVSLDLLNGENETKNYFDPNQTREWRNSAAS